jgi:hypothetical protein
VTVITTSLTRTSLPTGSTPLIEQTLHDTRAERHHLAGLTDIERIRATSEVERDLVLEHEE